MTKANEDWTINPATGRSNSSEQFEKLTIEVARLIRGSAHDLIAGNAGSVAHLIMAQLAHVHGMRPSEIHSTPIAEEKEQITALIHPSHKTGIEDHYPFGSAGHCSACSLSWRSGQVNPKLYQQCGGEPKTALCWFCKVSDSVDKLTTTSKDYGWHALGNERAHDTCANAWYELTARDRNNSDYRTIGFSEALCAVLCDFYYSTEGMTNLEHYADQLCKTLRQLGLIYNPQTGPTWSAYYITDLGKAFFKKVMVAPWYKPTTLQVQVDRLALYAESKGLTPHWLYLGRKQQQELDAWLPSTPQNLVNKFHTTGGVIEVIRLRATDELSLHGYVKIQTGVKEYGKPITLETVANQK